MSTPSSERTPATSGSASPRSTSRDLVTSQGRTSIADTVVAKIAGMAAREVSGVYRMGTGAARMFGAVRERIPGQVSNPTQGVSVEVGERQAAVDLDLVVDYGVSIAEVSTGVRRNVISAIERMTGLEVTEVNIAVDDVHLPGDTDGDAAEQRTEARVQ